MKTASAALKAHMAQEVTTLAVLFKLTREDGQVFAFTSHDKSLTFDDVVYSPVNSFSHTSIQSTAGMSVDNLDILALIDSDEVTESDLRAGKFRYASVIVYLVNWADISMGAMILRAGNLGEVTVNPSGTWTAELRGVMQPLQQTIGRLCTARCDADLGDARCGFDLSTRQQSGVVTAVASRSSFSVNGVSDDVFNGGLVTWTSGLNSGEEKEVKLWTGSPSDTIELFDAMYYNIQVGDTFTITPGCDKTHATCRDEFNNVVNFRGAPFIPGRDAVLSYPDSPN